MTLSEQAGIALALLGDPLLLLKLLLQGWQAAVFQLRQLVQGRSCVPPFSISPLTWSISSQLLHLPMAFFSFSHFRFHLFKLPGTELRQLFLQLLQMSGKGRPFPFQGGLLDFQLP